MNAEVVLRLDQSLRPASNAEGGALFDSGNGDNLRIDIAALRGDIARLTNAIVKPASPRSHWPPKKKSSTS